MKRISTLLLAVTMVAAVLAPMAWSQDTATVAGTCKDREGKLIVGATVQWVNQDTSTKYELKTNNRGEYFSLGIQPGNYKVSLIQNGQVLFYVNGYHVMLGGQVNKVDFDLQKEAAQQAPPQMTEEQKAAQEKAAKENANIKQLNTMLADSQTALQAGNFDQAINTLKQATTVDPSKDLVWFKLGEAYRAAGGKQTDPAQKKQMFEDAIAAYEKANQLKPNNAPYLNNIGDAYAKAGRTDDAVKAYTQAAQLDPTNAAQYWFNLGAVLTNTGKVDEAVQAFDKAIAADPNKADAYYWKGVNMLGKAKLEGNKMVAPEGTADAFNKYLALQPTGQFAEPAKQMLASMGATVETSFGKQKKKK
jgi:tetratricopeptide (TPR) repeat protein